MPIEYEAKILDIDPDAVAATIAELGGQHVGDSLMRRYVYDITPGDQSKWIRLRDNGSVITLAIKHIDHDGIDGTHETETEVGDFDTANQLLEQLGYVAKGYQENQRSSWRLDGVELEIDSWPLIPAYLEIEADSADAVISMAKRFGFTQDQLTSKNTTKIYDHYGIDLAAITELKFPSQ